MFISDPQRGARLTIIKWIPGPAASQPGTGPPEPLAHRLALLQAPAAFGRHLVGQPFEPIALPDGGLLLFQQPAGDASSWRPLTDLPARDQSRVIATVTRSLINDWNPDFDIRTQVELAQALEDEIDTDLVQRQLQETGDLTRFAWVRPDEDPPLVNPLRLNGSRSVFASTQIDLMIGRGHGDLHSENVLVEYSRGQANPGSFCLVDLLTYSPSAQLGGDIVRLLLSVTANMMVDLSPSQRGLLLPMLAAPNEPDSRQVPTVMSDIVRAVYRTAGKATVRCGADVWRRQYLLTLVGQALDFMTYENLGPSRRWWFFRLAGHAATQLLRELGRADEIPVSAPVFRNPFSARRQPIGVG